MNPIHLEVYDPFRIFISYSHENEIWLTEWADPIKQIPNPKYLLKLWERTFRKEKVEFWYDREPDKGLRGGDSWRDRIFEEIDKAQIAILLVTQEFVTSPFIMDEELPRIFIRHKKGEMEILPLFLQPTRMKDLADVDFLQFVPGGTPLSKYFETSQSGFDEARNQILDALANLIHKAKSGRARVDSTISQHAPDLETKHNVVAPMPALSPSREKIADNKIVTTTSLVKPIQLGNMDYAPQVKLALQVDLAGRHGTRPQFGLASLTVTRTLPASLKSGIDVNLREPVKKPHFKDAVLTKKGMLGDV